MEFQLEFQFLSNRNTQNIVRCDQFFELKFNFFLQDSFHSFNVLLQSPANKLFDSVKLLGTDLNLLAQ